MQNARFSCFERELGADAVFVDDDDFARLDLADELRVDEVERAGLAGEDVGAVELAERERAEAERIAHADDLALAHHHEREGALDLAQRGEDAAGAGRLREEVQDDFAVDGGLENGAALFEFVAQDAALTRLPLWPMAIWPRAQSTMSGCAFFRLLEPVVE